MMPATVAVALNTYRVSLRSMKNHGIGGDSRSNSKNVTPVISRQSSLRTRPSIQSPRSQQRRATMTQMSAVSESTNKQSTVGSSSSENITPAPDIIMIHGSSSRELLIPVEVNPATENAS